MLAQPRQEEARQRAASAPAMVSVKGLGQAASTVLLAALYLLFAFSHANAFLREPRLSVALLVIFETVIVALVITRRNPSRVFLGWQAWIATAGGTFMPLLLRPVEGGADMLVGQVFQMAGFALQIASALSLGRSFGLLPAERGIKTVGMYRLVRHPLYFSYLVAQFGYLISNPTAWNIAIMAVATAFQVLRIIQEESFLLSAPGYAGYSRAVRSRLVPGLW